MLSHLHASPFVSVQFTVLRCCLPEQRMFRASNSSVLFHFMSLLGLTMAAVTLGFNFYLEEPRQAEAVVYADVFTHLPEVNTLPLLDCCLSLSLLADPHVGCLKLEKRCLISLECVWPVSPAQHRPLSVTWPRRPLLCLSCSLRCKYSNSCSHYWRPAAPQ